MLKHALSIDNNDETVNLSGDVYRINKIIGSGSFGDVYEVERDYNIYALKVVKSHMYIDNVHVVAEDKQRNILKEATLQSHASDIGVAPEVYEYDANWILMEYLDGFSLAREPGHMDKCYNNRKSHCDIYSRVNEMYNELRDIEICHGDMHHHNIMLVRPYTVRGYSLKVVDFGEAHAPGEERWCSECNE